MVAALSLRVYTGASAATESAAVSGIDLVSADSDANSLSNRQANPIALGTNSFEKWLKLKVDVPPANYVRNFQVWGGGSVDASTALMVAGNHVTAATPTDATSTVATDAFTTHTAGNKLVWDTGSYTHTSDVTRFLVAQLQSAADAGGGSWTQEIVNYSFDEG